MNRLLTAFYSLTLDDQDLEYFKFRAIEREALEDSRALIEEEIARLHHCWANELDPTRHLEALRDLSTLTGINLDHQLGLA